MHYTSSRYDYEKSLAGYSPDKLCFSPNSRKEQRVSISNANASWDLLVEPKGSSVSSHSSRIQGKDVRSLRSLQMNKTPTGKQEGTSPSTSQTPTSKPVKRSSFTEDPEVNFLLKMLQTDSFVGEIDPVYHSRYVASCEDPQHGTQNLNNNKRRRSTSGRLVASYKSDGHLLNMTRKYDKERETMQD
jgi:hypothetical protein